MYKIKSILFISQNMYGIYLCAQGLIIEIVLLFYITGLFRDKKYKCTIHKIIIFSKTFLICFHISHSFHHQF